MTFGTTMVSTSLFNYSKNHAPMHNGKEQARLTVGIVMQARARMKNDKTAASDGLVPEIAKCIPSLLIYQIYWWFAARLEGWTRAPAFWFHIVMSFLRKAPSPKKFSQLRGGRPRKWKHICNCGFERGREVVDVAGSIMILLNRSSEWVDEAPAYIFEGDIRSAFDYMTHELAEKGMKNAGWPENLVAAVNSSNTTSTVSAQIASLDIDEFNINSCYRQGSVEGPRIWKLIVMTVLGYITPIWYEMGFGLQIDSWVNASGEVISNRYLVVGVHQSATQNNGPATNGFTECTEAFMESDGDERKDNKYLRDCAFQD